MSDIRLMRPDDLEASFQAMHTALTDLSVRMGEAETELTPEVRSRGLARIAHLQRTDPDASLVAEVDGEVVGCAMALVREGMWFLSLLMVQPAHQSSGVGRELLDAVLTTATERSWITSSPDPRALRRYQRAGFDLHPAYRAKGEVDRSRLPAVTGLRDADDDRDTLDAVLRAVRGAGMGPEADYFREHGSRILVAPGKGFAVLRSSGTNWLAATDEATARELLWSVLAEATEPPTIDWLTADQAWAVDVCLDAGLALSHGGSLALRGQPPMSPYLACGAFG